MTKSFEVSIAIMFLLSFIFFVIEITSTEYRTIEIPENTKNLVLLKAQDQEFRKLIKEDDAENIFRLLYNDIDQEYVIKICNPQTKECIVNNKGNIKYKRELEYYFTEMNKTLSIGFIK